MQTATTLHAPPPLDALRPKERVALRAALASPTHTLVRTRGGFTTPAHAARTGAQSVQVVTTRCANWLERDGLVRFEPPTCPERITLTDTGLQMARELAQQHGQAGHA